MKATAEAPPPAPAAPPAAAGERKTRLAWLILAVAMLAAAAAMLWWGRNQSFLSDEWTYLLYRRPWSPEDLLGSSNGHLILVPLTIYKVMFETLGLGSYFPYLLQVVVLNLVIAALFYLLARRRIGPLGALGPTVLLLFFGAGWEASLHGNGNNVLLALAAGLGMLLALDRRDLRGDIGACALLTVSLASFSVGLVFALGAAVDLSLRPDRRRRAWIFIGPVALWFVWWLWHPTGIGQAPGPPDLAGAPSAFVDAISAVAAALTGLYTSPFRSDVQDRLTIDPDLGIPVAIACIALLVVRVARGPKPDPRFWALAAMAGAYWAMIALAANQHRLPTASRYVLPGSLLALLLFSEALAGVRLARWARIGLVAVLGYSLAVNAYTLERGGSYYRQDSEYNRAQLAALELVRSRIDFFLQPEADLEGTRSFLPHWDLPAADSYFSISDAYGSPAFSEAELLAAPPGPRDRADHVLAGALRIEARPVSRLPRPPGQAQRLVADGTQGGAPVRSGRCLELQPTGSEAAYLALHLPRPGISFEGSAGTAVEVSLKRFGDGFAAHLAPTAGPAIVKLPPDGVNRPWRAVLGSAATTTVCPLE